MLLFQQPLLEQQVLTMLLQGKQQEMALLKTLWQQTI
jgi:hypothetical protein